MASSERENAGMGVTAALFTQARQESELQSGCFVMEMWQVGAFEVPVTGPLQPGPPSLQEQLTLGSTPHGFH